MDLAPSPISLKRMLQAVEGPEAQRITVRLLAYWERLRAARDLPSEPEIDPDDLYDLWDYCFLVQVRDLYKEDYNYTYLGPAIVQAYHGSLSADDAGGMVSPNANKLSHNYARIIDSKQPIIEEGEFLNMAGELVKYRQCLLPFGVGGVVDSIFGGMRFKIFRDH